MLKKIENEDKKKNRTHFIHSKAEIIVNESDNDDVFKSIYTTVISNIQKSLGKGLCWIIDSVIQHIHISKYNPLAGNCYIKLRRKELINTQNVDNNGCFKWCIVRYLNPADHNPRRITKNILAKRLNLKAQNFQSKLEI